MYSKLRWKCNGHLYHYQSNSFAYQDQFRLQILPTTRTNRPNSLARYNQEPSSRRYTNTNKWKYDCLYRKYKDRERTTTNNIKSGHWPQRTTELRRRCHRTDITKLNSGCYRKNVRRPLPLSLPHERKKVSDATVILFVVSCF